MPADKRKRQATWIEPDRKEPQNCAELAVRLKAASKEHREGAEERRGARGGLPTDYPRF